MKNFAVFHILLFLIFMLAYQCASAQDYVATTKADTLRGSIKLLIYGADKKVQVTDNQKKKTTLSILQTRTVSIKNELYQPVRNDKGYTFMKLIKPGYLSLYAFQPENQTNYDGRYLVRKDGPAMEVPNLSFKKLMAKFLSDCPTVSDKIDAGTLGKKNLLQIVDEYNVCIDTKTSEHKQAIAVQQVQTKELSNWDTLEAKIKAASDFEGKTNALEMITEIKNKVGRGEKIPNFLIEGLKNSVSKTDLKGDVENALKEITTP